MYRSRGWRLSHSEFRFRHFSLHVPPRYRLRVMRHRKQGTRDNSYDTPQVPYESLLFFFSAVGLCCLSVSAFPTFVADIYVLHGQRRHRKVLSLFRPGTVGVGCTVSEPFLSDSFRNENTPNDVPRAVPAARALSRCRVHRSVRRRCSRVRCAVRFSGVLSRPVAQTLALTVIPFSARFAAFRLVHFCRIIPLARRSPFFRGVSLIVFRPCGIPKQPLLSALPLSARPRSRVPCPGRSVAALAFGAVPSKRVVCAYLERWSVLRTSPVCGCSADADGASARSRPRYDLLDAGNGKRHHVGHRLLVC